MANTIDRRLWLKQTSVLLAGLGLTESLFGADRIATGNRPSASAILLNSNENPYGPSPLARQAMLDWHTASNRYPDDLLPLLKKKIATHWGVGEENILLGAGSSEIIGLACLHAARQKGHVLTTDPGYSVWNGQASAFGLPIKGVPLPRRGGWEASALFRSATPDTRMIYICNPNNPMGIAMNVADVGRHAEEAAKTSLVFVDEAYTDYIEMDSLAKLAAATRNIIVAKTFSKIYGLAGARLGYAIAHPDIINSLRRFQPWSDSNASTLSIAAALASLDDKAFVAMCRKNVAAAKKQCYAALKEIGAEAFPSSANFILFNIEKWKSRFENQMAQQNIKVQCRRHYGEQWCRVTIGTAEEMQQFRTALKGLQA